VTPILEGGRDNPLPPIIRAELVWDRGETEFHQEVPVDPQNPDPPISGRFTGPSAEELIGGLSLTYVAADGRVQTGGAAFIAKRNP
jgi:hypothetical protein